MPFGFSMDMPLGGFDELTAGGFDELTAGGFDELTAGRLRTPNFAGGDTRPWALRQAQETKFRRRRNLVEAAGVEPASENIPLGRLHTYPEI
jgi:hypothetical protein